LSSKTPIQTMKNWYASHPHLFLKRPYDRPGCDRMAIPVDPAAVLRSSPAELPELMEGLLLAELESPAYAMPQKFDRQRLLADLKAALA